MNLYDALHRVADDAPPLHPDTDRAWRRGRRRHRRRQVSGVLAAAAAVVVVTGLVSWLPGLVSGPDAPFAGGGADLGVPDHVYAVPQRVDMLKGDLAVGQAAAAFVTAEGIPVVVGADDGAYHLLDLPGYIGGGSDVGLVDMDDYAAVTLSPDGRRLAYGWAEDAGAGSEVPSGVRTVDLVRGSVSTVTVDEGLGVRATRLTWSPGGRWLVWTGLRIMEWDREQGMSASYGAAGRIGPRALSSDPVETGALTIDDDGAVRRTTGSSSFAPAPDGTLASGSPDGSTVRFRDRGTRFVGTAPVTGVTGGPARLEPLGWVGDDAAVVTAEPEDESPTQLLLVGPDVEARSIGRVDGSPRGLSLATDLMTVDRPTVDRPEPDWRWSTTRWVFTGLGVAVLLGLGWILVVDRRRRALGGPVRGMPPAAEHSIRDDRFGPMS